MTARSVYLRGGMGNQFFQWIFALWLAQDGAATTVDHSFIRSRKGNQARGRLELLHLFPDMLLPIQARWKSLARIEPVLARLARACGRLSDDSALSEGGLRQATHHYGYYQQSRFFLELEGNTRQWLKACAAPPSAGPPEELRNIGPYAALHVRAGDYRLNAYNRYQLGVLHGSYYESALSCLREHAPEQPIIIVSDDFASCRAVIPQMESTPGVVYLDRLSPRSGDSQVALQVLLHAKGLSCANSSFSAMAAYLGHASHVIAPTPWFRSDTLRHVAPQLPSWQRLAAGFEVKAWK